MFFNSHVVTRNCFTTILLTGFLALLPSSKGLGQLVYTNNFENPVGLEWSRTNRDVTPIGARTFLGQFGNGTVTLALTNLPPHTEADLSFDLLIIRSWDGLASLSSAYEIWSVGIGGGPILLRTTFCPFEQASNARQSYPAPYGRGSFPPNTGAAERFSLGYYFYVQDKTYFWDAVYRLDFRFTHSGNSLVLNFAASALEPLDNESWGLDNIAVALDTIVSDAPPRITRQPNSQTAALNGPAAFIVVATTNSPLSYQWRFNGSDLPAQINPYLVIPRAQPSNVGLYSVVTSNSFGSVVSEPARLTVGPPFAGPPPFDAIKRDSNALVLAWSNLGTNAILEKTTDLVPPTAWTNATVAAGWTGGQIVATIPIETTNEFFRLRSGPSLTDFWDGKAEWIPDAEGLGHDFGFHFPSMLAGDRDIWAYYIANYSKNGQSKSAVGRARSMDGIVWINDGMVMDIGGEPRWFYQSEQRSFVDHKTGRWEPDGWSATPGIDPPDHMVYGPYTTEVAGGTNTARFRLMIDQHTGLNDIVAVVDVNDGALLKVLATRTIYRNDFAGDMTYQEFDLPFQSRTGQNLEFRVWFAGTAYVKSDYAAVIQGTAPFWDDRLATFPGVWKDSATYYLVYEGAAENLALSPGDIGLATSSDGRHFVKNTGNPILRHNPSGWESVNVGTPSLFKENGVWYLFYHGFDGSKVRIGVASGTTLTDLIKYAGNPIFSPDAGAWDSGTAGRRSAVVKEASYYYFAYEGSTDYSFNTAQWSSGLARSTNLLDWVKYPSNPVIPQTLSGFGYDGPELVRLDGTWYLYVRMSFDPEAPTKRFRLAWRP